MRSRFAAALGVLLLAATPLATAGPAAAQTAAQQDQAADLQTWLGDVAVWTQGYDTLTTSRVDTLVWLLESAEVLMERLETGGAAAARPWATTWAVQARARLAREMQTYQTLSTQAPAFPSSVPTTESFRARITVVGQTSDQIGALMISTGQACEEYIDVIEAAGSGKSSDLARVDSARLGLLVAQLQAENTMMAAATAGLDGPNLHFAHSQVASNRALIVWLGHNKRLFAGEPIDATVTARDIRGHAATMRTDIAAMRSSAEEIAAGMAGEPGFSDTPLAALFDRLLISLGQSADVEAQIADALDQMAVAVQSEDETADDDVAATIEGLATQRLALYSARLELMARSGG